MVPINASSRTLHGLVTAFSHLSCSKLIKTSRFLLRFAVTTVTTPKIITKKNKYSYHYSKFTSVKNHWQLPLLAFLQGPNVEGRLRSNFAWSTSPLGMVMEVKGSLSSLTIYFLSYLLHLWYLLYLLYLLYHIVSMISITSIYIYLSILISIVYLGPSPHDNPRVEAFHRYVGAAWLALPLDFCNVVFPATSWFKRPIVRICLIAIAAIASLVTNCRPTYVSRITKTHTCD